MQNFSNYVPERNYPSKMHNIASILLFKYMLHVMLFPTRKFLNYYYYYHYYGSNTYYQRLGHVIPGHTNHTSD